MNGKVILSAKKIEFINLIKDKSWFNKKLVDKALEFGETKHRGDTRKVTGDPYFIHPIQVAINILGEKDTDLNVVVAALLHDTVENTDTSLEDIKEQFNEKIKILVDGMTKPDPKLKSKLGKDTYYENYFLHLEKISTEDIRVLKVKLSDRIDNLSTYKLFADSKKVENYIWESYQYLDICEKMNLVTNLISVLKERLRPLEEFINQ
ncbi:MAG: HD domain-containing protein [Candidatus Hodarchaeales archaeon]|jgi:(p)ppGpp synthase/HD superfamily hydrolase